MVFRVFIGDKPAKKCASCQRETAPGERVHYLNAQEPWRFFCNEHCVRVYLERRYERQADDEQ